MSSVCFGRPHCLLNSGVVPAEAQRDIFEFVLFYYLRIFFIIHWYLCLYYIVYSVVLPSRDTTPYPVSFRIVRWLILLAAASDVGP